MIALGGEAVALGAAERIGGIVVFGDSTTALRAGVSKVYAVRISEALAASGTELAVVNAGVGGNTTRDAVKRFERDVLLHRPRFLVIQFGINDSAVDVWKQPPATVSRVPLPEYVRNLRTMIRSAREQQIHVILMTPNPLRWTPKLKELYGRPPYDPLAEEGFESATLLPYVAAVRQMAAKMKVPLVDVHAAYPSFAARHQTTVDGLLLDGMHPNDRGHELVTELILPLIHAAQR
jgi:lysophospholipase L1-like esterase